jgi:hypothetical protein
MFSKSTDKSGFFYQFLVSCKNKRIQDEERVRLLKEERKQRELAKKLRDSFRFRKSIPKVILIPDSKDFRDNADDNSGAIECGVTRRKKIISWDEVSETSLDTAFDSVEESNEESNKASHNDDEEQDDIEAREIMHYHTTSEQGALDSVLTVYPRPIVRDQNDTHLCEKNKHSPPSSTVSKGRIRYLPDPDISCDSDISLNDLIIQRHWISAWIRLQQCPHEAAEWLIRTSKKGTIIYRKLPLHIALRLQAPERFLRDLINAFPEALHQVDEKNLTPLDHAGNERNKVSSNILLQIMDHYENVKD